MTAIATEQKPVEAANDSVAADAGPPTTLDPKMVRQYVQEGRPLKELIGLPDNVWETMYDFGYRNFQNGQLAVAEYWWTQVCLFDSANDRNWIALGVACKRQLKFQDAINAFSLAVHNGSTNPWGPLHAAECYLQMNDLFRAGKALDSAAEWAGNSDEQDVIVQRIAMLRRGIERKKKAAAD